MEMAVKIKNKQVCPYCKKEFKKGVQKFCSKNRYNLFQHKRVEKICLVCGKKFTVWESLKNKRKFCSRKCSSIHMSQERIGSGNPMYGKTQWSEGKKFTTEHKRKLSVARTGIFVGEKCPAWKGGITPIVQKLRHCFKYVQWRSQVFIKDNFTCKCGKRGGWLEAHHKVLFSKLLQEAKHCFPLLDLYDAAIEYDPLWDVRNGKTMCKECHNKTKRMGGNYEQTNYFTTFKFNTK